MSRERSRNELKTAGIDSGRRAQTLSLDEWHRLYIALS